MKKTKNFAVECCDIITLKKPNCHGLNSDTSASEDYWFSTPDRAQELADATKRPVFALCQMFGSLVSHKVFCLVSRTIFVSAIEFKIYLQMSERRLSISFKKLKTKKFMNQLFETSEIVFATWCSKRKASFMDVPFTRKGSRGVLHSIRSASSTKAVRKGNLINEHANWILNSNTLEKYDYKLNTLLDNSTQIQNSTFTPENNITLEVDSESTRIVLGTTNNTSVDRSCDTVPPFTENTFTNHYPYTYHIQKKKSIIPSATYQDMKDINYMLSQKRRIKRTSENM
ncbi:hypothetical protein BDB01DRAFT_852875 [Pilobolus umbonatus]|nr:hypothetical protein BDB01DRAFT_852875 [Pilobolus umbonatus]